MVEAANFCSAIMILLRLLYKILVEMVQFLGEQGM
jgi:hypothetical protein